MKTEIVTGGLFFKSCAINPNLTELRVSKDKNTSRGLFFILRGDYKLLAKSVEISQKNTDLITVSA